MECKGDGKTGDSTNFGIFKQNWYMLRHSASEFLGETVGQVDDGAILKYIFNLKNSVKQLCVLIELIL